MLGFMLAATDGAATLLWILAVVLVIAAYPASPEPGSGSWS